MPSRQPAKKTTARPAKALTASTHEVQAAAEGVEVLDDGKVELLGEYFRIRDRVGLMPLMRFAVASRKGIDSADMEGLAAMYALVKGCIHREDWDRFEQHAEDRDAQPDEVFAVVQRVMELVAARPTAPPGDSSTGRPTTSANSKASSSRTGTPPPEGMVSVDSLLDR